MIFNDAETAVAFGIMAYVVQSVAEPEHFPALDEKTVLWAKRRLESTNERLLQPASVMFRNAIAFTSSDTSAMNGV